MDPFEHITRQCQISSSQEQILRDLILSIDSQEDRLNILSNDEEGGEPNPHGPNLFSLPTPIIICSPPDTAPSNEEQQSHVRRNSPQNRAGFDGSNNTQKSEPTKIKPSALEKDPMICDPPHARRNSAETTTILDDANDTQKSEPTKVKLPELEKDPVIWESTTNRCSTLKEKSSMETNLGLLEPSMEKACICDGMDIGFAEKRLEELGFLKEKGDCSSKDNGVGGENGENTKKSKQGSSVESEICEEADDDGNAVSVSRVFGRLAGSVCGEGNAEKHVGSLRKSPAASENAGGLRRLPSWIRNQSKEKEGRSSGRGDMALEKSIIAKLMEVASALSKEREQGTGDVDILQAAEQAGSTSGFMISVFASCCFDIHDNHIILHINSADSATAFNLF
ncbi:hypothetical protein CKAN_00784000 [Cinnamomum micranthum f. kanehirae]|uniref:Uncharacterized protein n=1 Tax=Cinnamomum micranthum f. kanehirae TaxID=337451 RepID=A0A3S5WGG1_9MAGN|nr:hypothetical protein CKAN_00784000 [Cinnamomum micranthum f. kanehirae]